MKTLKLEFNEQQLIIVYQTLLTTITDQNKQKEELENSLQEVSNNLDSNLALIQKIRNNLPQKILDTLQDVSISNTTTDTLPVFKEEQEEIKTRKTNSIETTKGSRGTYKWKDKIIFVFSFDINAELTIDVINSQIFKHCEDVKTSDMTPQRVKKMLYSYCSQLSSEGRLVVRNTDGKIFYSLNPNHPDNKNFFPDDEEEIIEQHEVHEQVVPLIIQNERVIDSYSNQKEEEEKDDEEVTQEFEDDDLKYFDESDYSDSEDESDEDFEIDNAFKEKPVTYIRSTGLSDNIEDDPEWKERMRSQGHSFKKK